ncbi:MAG: flagellar export chaperone FliS [Balneolaceae bacterium]
MTNPHNEYERQTIQQANPEELVARLYDMAIQSCHQKDSDRTRDILDTLIKSLNFEYEISSALYELYSYCKEILNEDKFDEVRTLLEPIRESWNEGVVAKKMGVNRINKNGFLA